MIKIKGKYCSIDLFSGAGGLSLGFEMAGFKPQVGVEFNHECVQTYKKNHPNTTIIEKDIRLVETDSITKILEDSNFQQVDVITGGPPCEGFSLAGKRDVNDPRNKLFNEYIRFVEDLRPYVAVMENVSGILNMKSDKNEKVGDLIKRSFNSIGYKVDHKVLLATDYGVPQHRKRVFFIATRLDTIIRFPKPTHFKITENQAQLKGDLKPYVNVNDAICDLPPLKPGEEKNQYESPPLSGYQQWARENVMVNTLSNHKAVNHRHYMVERFKRIPPGKGIKEAWESIPEEYRPKKVYSARNRRLSLDRPSFTVTAHCLDEIIHPIQDRGLTPREAARLQSFPDWYLFEGPHTMFHSDPRQDQYEQIGDAVPPLLARAIAFEVLNMIKSCNTETKG